jgi:hypothetical protein
MLKVDFTKNNILLVFYWNWFFPTEFPLPNLLYKFFFTKNDLYYRFTLFIFKTNFFGIRLTVATLLWESVTMKLTFPKMGTWESSRTLETLESNCKSQNTLHWSVIYIIGKILKLDVENGLAWAIWTSLAHVMAKRRVESQNGSLTPDH